jgi:murein L,D-transpeptidase YcbB/YkuD
MPARIASSLTALLAAGGMMLPAGVVLAQSAATDVLPPPAASAAEAGPTESRNPFSTALSERLLKSDPKMPAKAREDRAALLMFYGQRQNAPVWTAEDGLSKAGKLVMTELARADDWGLEASAFRIAEVGSADVRFPGAAEQANAELELSTAILKYARFAHGGRAEPTALSRFIDRQLTYVEPQKVIAEIAASEAPDAYLRSLHPHHPQFELLRQKLLEVRQRGTSVAAPAAKSEKSAAKGEGAKSKAEAKPDKGLVKKLLVNMEQWRWMPDDLGATYINVNVPEYMLRIVKDGKVFHSERVIVGKVDKQTPIFSEGMAQVIFNPTWGVPDSIKRNEIYPDLVKGKMRILSRNNLKLRQNGKDVDPESVDWGTADIRRFQVVQPSGDKNVLGVVKFRFPNKHDVYMHDTPTKKLFDTEVRAYSHGCVRVREPEKFASLLLAADQGWSASRVAATIKANQENQTVNLKQKVPVHLTYFTAVVGDDGKLKLFNDVYGHEHRIAVGMEGKAHTLPREKEEIVKVDVVGSLNEARPSTSTTQFKDEWARRAFQQN